jgi:hypothetical protein
LDAHEVSFFDENGDMRYNVSPKMSADSDSRELKPMPHGQVEALTVNKRSVARSQLETAIQIWFLEGDPVSIHTLAVAAHDCFNALHKHTTSKPSYMEEWLASKPKSFQKQARMAQNFLKHGYNELKGTLRLTTIQAEMLMMDAVTCYERIGEKPTPLMRLYAQRFLYEHPYLITKDALPVYVKNAENHQLTNSTRTEFLHKLLPIFVARYGDSQQPSK